MLDQQYSTDSQAAMNTNLIMTSSVIAIQATSEDKPLPWDEFLKLKTPTEEAIAELLDR